MAEKIKQIFTDEVTRNKIDKHLSDPNDQITDQDIENVITDVTPNTEIGISEEEQEVIETLNEKNKKEDDEDGNNSNAVETPWKILD